MAASDYDVVGIGNAIVDVLAKAEEGFLVQHKLAKGAMTLIDAPTAGHPYQAMAPATECSGGSVPDTMAGIASLGGPGAFTRTDFADQLRRRVHPDHRPPRDAVSTAPRQCM